LKYNPFLKQEAKRTSPCFSSEAEVMEEYRREGQIFQLAERCQGRVMAQPALFPGLTLDLGEVWA